MGQESLQGWAGLSVSDIHNVNRGIGLGNPLPRCFHYLHNWYVGVSTTHFLPKWHLSFQVSLWRWGFRALGVLRVTALLTLQLLLLAGKESCQGILDLTQETRDVTSALCCWSKQSQGASVHKRVEKYISLKSGKVSLEERVQNGRQCWWYLWRT